MRNMAFGLILLSAFWSGLAFGADHCRVRNHLMTCSGETVGDISLVVAFPDERVTTDTTSATLCTSSDTAVTRVLLYMDMGGGHDHSFLADISRRPDGCTAVTHMEFSMRGHWEIRVRLANGDRGVVHVDVE